VSDVVFTAARRFDPTCGEAWKKYIAWSGLTQLREVISLDTILCPNIFVELTADDWKHNVHADFRTHLFYGVDHVIAVVGDQPVNVLALMEEPSAAEVTGFTDERFIFRGFDLLEYPLGISALVNCGGFDKAFLPGDLSACGLLVDHEKARTVQERLRTEYPSEPHAQCRLWAIWQKREK
jgi:hypothetical protein